MDEFNRTLLEAAYQTIARRKRRETPNATAVLNEMYHAWVQWRDVLIGQRANYILARVPADRLRYLADVLQNLLYTRDFPIGAWESADEGDEAEWSAWTLACLRWHYREMDGREPVVTLTHEQVVAWIAEQEGVPVHQNPAQPSLFTTAKVW